ncbi:MAG TPA: dipeptide/oligopeptide/nickel ABC transporter ATP-binding protein [Candidatus Eremiobacteraceae bacterium]|nr:dipeptide/oligopeptide/nickel ABC transporter ATP-binding protein [Candidatus Eremiobacteraceae bacterium]
MSLTVENLVKRYLRRNAAASEEVVALRGISFSIRPGSTLAVVGGSGSGKSTLALCVAGFEEPTSGTICFDGAENAKLDANDRRKKRSQIQLIFQDPASSLNPRWRVSEILAEPFVLQKQLSGDEIKHQAQVLLGHVGLSQAFLNRRPGELSGGQRQRLAIARALALEPRLLILDEALSAMDCSVQAQIANLLVDLQSSLGMTYLFITHDLAMAAHLADEIAVMAHGQIVEQGSAEKIVTQPAHQETRDLLSAMPHLPRAMPQAPGRP